MAKILAVDDSPYILELIKASLTAPEYEVITAGNGAEAIVTAKKTDPDLILMDIIMPVMDGFEATRAIKNDPSTRNIPVLILTATRGDEQMVKGLDAGADDFLEKSFTVEVLRARVRAHLRVKTLLDSLELAGKDQQMIADIMKDTTSSLDIYKVLHTITKKTAGYLDLFRCSVVRIEKEKDYGVVIASSDDPDIGGLCIKLENYPEIQTAMKTFDVLVIDDITSDPLMAEAIVPQSLRSIMLIPLIYKDELIGTMYLKGDSSKKGFSKRETDLAGMIAGSAVNAIKNAFLYEELKKNKDEIEESNRKLMELDKFRADFLAMAAHELRSPLSVVNGYIEMLIEGAAGPLSPKTMNFLTTALEGGNRLAGTVESILDITAIESGRLSLNTEEGDIIRNINRVLNFMNKQAEEKNITLCGPSDSESVKALFDAEKIDRVLINLLSNAIKFTPPCGNITITVNGTDNEVIITISDTGCGIPQEELSQIFDDFYKGRSREKGTGLGLSICKKLVEMHGGRIWVDSSTGEGSSFHFTLPGKKA